MLSLRGKLLQRQSAYEQLRRVFITWRFRREREEPEHVCPLPRHWRPVRLIQEGTEDLVTCNFSRHSAAFSGFPHFW